MTRLAIDPEVSRRFPDVLVGALRATGLKGGRFDDATVETLFERARLNLLAAGVTAETLANQPHVQAWRAAVASCGIKPSTFRSSPEQLAKRLLKGGVSTPLALVNLYCAVSVLHLTPLGAYDVSRLPAGELALRPGRPGRDTFSPLGARAEDMPITDRVIVYASGDEVVCWGFNHRDSRRTCLVPETETAIFVGEAVVPQQHTALRQALNELRDLLLGAGTTATTPAFADLATPTFLL